MSGLNKVADIFYSQTMGYIASGVVGFLILCYSIYNGYFYIFKPKKYKGIRFTTKNIAYITMLSAVSVTVTIVVSISFPITVFPPIRIAFEGLMVKITGLMFGPIVGLLSGVITDCLALLFVPSYVHIAYLIVIGSFGFLSGCMGVLNKQIGDKKWIMMLFLNVFLFIFGGVSILMTIGYHGTTVQIFSGTYISKTVLIYALTFASGGTIVLIWLLYAYLMLTPKRRKIWSDLLPVLALAIITEYWVTSLISAWGDIAFITASQGGGKGYAATLLTRLVMAPAKIIFNTAVIFITYKALNPLIHKDETQTQTKIKSKILNVAAIKTVNN